MSREYRGNADALTNEQKILVVNGWDLLDRTQEKASRVRGMDMTWRMQLRSDCKALEKALKEMEKNPSDAADKKLQQAYLRLKTSAEHILEYDED